MPALRIEPVIEVFGDDAFDLWPVMGRGGLWYLALDGDATDREVGTAVHQILRWFYCDDQGSPALTVEEYLARALAPHGPDDESPVVQGGLRFTDTDTGATVLPGCCCSIDERSELLDVLDRGKPTCWFGHDPDASLTVRDGVVEIAQDADDPNRPVLRFAPDQVRVALTLVEDDLDRFCGRVSVWAAEHIPRQFHTLADAIAQALEAGSHRTIGRTALIDNERA